MLLRVVTLLLLAAGLSACGYKGPLKLPASKAPAAPPAAPAAVNPAPPVVLPTLIVPAYNMPSEALPPVPAEPAVSTVPLEDPEPTPATSLAP